MPFELRKAPGRQKYWVVDPSGKHYSIKPLPLERAKAQQRALYAAEGRGELKGDGLFDSLKEAYNQVADSDSAMWSSVKQVGDLDSEFWSRQYYPKYVQQWLDKNGSIPVTSLRVRRAPIAAGLDYAFQLVTQGKWQDAKNKVGYDNMFHLSLIGNGGQFLMEKLDRINVTDKVDSPPGPEYMDVPNVKDKGKTIKQMLDATQALMGNRFFPYHPFQNNCQVFIVKILEANGLLTDELFRFVFQPVDQIVSDLPGYTSAFAQTLTNLGANINTVIDQAWGLVGLGRHSLDDFKPKTRRGKTLRGGAVPAGQSVLWEVADSAYKRGDDSKEELPGGFYLVEKTDGMVLYTDGETTAFVGVRGTRPSDTDDLYADSLIPQNMLGTSPRYERDNSVLEGWKQKYPQLTEWFGIGHSLGGAIVDEFLRRGMVQEGFSFNPAIQPRDYKSDKHFRIYREGDPLYLIMGQFDPKAVVVPRGEEGWLYWAWRRTGLGLLYDTLVSHKLGAFKDIKGGAGPADLQSFKTDVPTETDRRMDGVGADVFMGGGRHQDAEAVFAALEGGAMFPKAKYDSWERNAAERMRDQDREGNPNSRSLRDQELGWRAIAHIDPAINPLSELGARVLADDLFEHENPGTAVDPGHVLRREFAAKEAYNAERENAKQLKAQVDRVVEEQGFTGKTARQQAYAYILDQRRRRAAAAEAAPGPRGGPPPPPPPGPPKPAPKKPSPKKPSPKAAPRAEAAADVPFAAAGGGPSAEEIAEARRLEREANEAAARSEAEARATRAKEAERARAAAAEAKARTEREAAEAARAKAMKAAEEARAASAAAKDKKKKAAAEAKQREAEEEEYLTKETLATKRIAELLVPLDSQIAVLKLQVKDDLETMRDRDSYISNTIKYEMLIPIRSVSDSSREGEAEASIGTIRTILATPEGEFKNVRPGQVDAYKEYLRGREAEWERLHALEMKKIAKYKAEVANLQERITAANAEITRLESEKKDLDARVRREMTGRGGQHKPFPYSRPGLTKDERAKERAKHYREVLSLNRRWESKVQHGRVKETLEKTPEDRMMVDAHYAKMDAKRREQERKHPEKKLAVRNFGYMFEVEAKPDAPAAFKVKLAARGPNPPREKMPKKGSERKPYVGSKMKEQLFMESPFGDEADPGWKKMLNQAKRLYKEGGKSWESVMRQVLGQ
jgi:hypothetical protein